MDEISIIIPTYKRDHLAQTLMESIHTFHPDVEVIIESGHDNTSRAKNIGWRRSKGDICVFFDDDVEITRDTLGSMLECYENSAIAGVAGRVINDHECIPDDTNVQTGKTNKLLTSFSFNFWSTLSQTVHFPYGCCQSYRREVLEATNGFDEDFPKVFEEVDLGLRVSKLIGKIQFEPRALVYHHKAPTGGNRGSSHFIDTFLYRAYGRMIAKHTPLFLQPITLLLRSRNALSLGVYTELMSGYISFYTSKSQKGK